MTVGPVHTHTDEYPFPLELGRRYGSHHKQEDQVLGEQAGHNEHKGKEGDIL